MANGHGGRRPGAGRKPGSQTAKIYEIARRAAEEGLTPIQVMLFVMRHHFDAERYDDAAAVARDAAPYVHPRLSAVAVSGGETPVRLRLVEEIVITQEASANGTPVPQADLLAPDA